MKVYTHYKTIEEFNVLDRQMRILSQGKNGLKNRE